MAKIQLKNREREEIKIPKNFFNFNDPKNKKVSVSIGTKLTSNG
jgi:hypothetical protein